jgi:hypothetical protein
MYKNKKLGIPLSIFIKYEIKLCLLIDIYFVPFFFKERAERKNIGVAI